MRPASRVRSRVVLALGSALLTLAASAEAQSSAPAERPEAAGASRTGGLRIAGFVVGSLSYNSHLQLLPEFAGGVPALAPPRSTNFAFDKIGLGFSRTLTPWLSASGTLELESHRDIHSHGFDPAFGCPGTAPCNERFGSEAPQVDAVLDRFSLTAVAPLGNGLALSIGRFDLPFGIERHDEVLLLTATTSEIFRWARPQRMTGLQAAYPFGPKADLSVWLVNRWESENSGVHDFNDNNKSKSFGGRLGVTPSPRDKLLAFGLGGFVGTERTGDSLPKRWVVDLDATYSPSPSVVLAAEAVRGGEGRVSMRERGTPIAEPAAVKDSSWTGLSAMAHVDPLSLLGITLRYGWLDDRDGARTGVTQKLTSWTLVPIVHLSRRAREGGSTGTAYARTRHLIDSVDVKLEYRINRSNRPVFTDAAAAVDILRAQKTSHQLQLQLVWNFF
jgi:hypothetical protein